MAQDRDTFQRLAEARLAEAEALMAAGHPSGAYYLAGYAVECALKALISQKFRAHEIPDKNLVNRAYTHNLGDLSRLAGIDARLNDAAAIDPDLKRRWSTVVTWSEQARYDAWSEQSARALIDAADGVVRWLTEP